MKGKVIYVDFLYNRKKVGYFNHKVLTFSHRLISKFKNFFIKDNSSLYTNTRVKKVQ